MSTGGGASYLPVFVRPEEASNDGAGTGAANGEYVPGAAMGEGRGDPLYAALLGGKIGSALGPAAEQETLMNTLDEEGTWGWLLKRHGWYYHLAILSRPFVTVHSSSLPPWDLWGPLVNSLILAVTLALGASSSTSAVSLFTLTMSWCWLGGILVAANLRLLGYRVSLLPALAFLGYALGPSTAAALFSLAIPRWLAPIKWLGVGIALVWALAAAVRLLEADPALEDRRVLASYPLILYYGLLTWIMLIY